MFPVRMVLCHLEGTPRYLEGEVQDLFAEDIGLLGGGHYQSHITMTAGVIGTGSYYQYRLYPRDALALGVLIEYAEECHHGFAIIVMRDIFKSYTVPSPLTMAEYGHVLDALNPNDLSKFQDREEVAQIIEDWNNSKDYISRLELENSILRSRLE